MKPYSNLSEQQKSLFDTIEKIFVNAETLKSKYGKDYEKIPAGAIGMYTFCDRLMLGLQQLMAGARKFSINHLERKDLVSLTKEAVEVTGIPYVMESDMAEAEKIMFGIGLKEVISAS